MIAIRGVDHIGIRVIDRKRSVDFYGKLGFEVTQEHDAGRVVVLRNAAGVEINFIVNGAEYAGGQNPLMDIAEKYPGYTHVALAVESMDQTIATLGRVGIPISEGPQRLGAGLSLFIRDPDRNVIELRQKPASPGR
jgi:lactoylglutathione lyase